jgi:hypothetical protein
MGKTLTFQTFLRPYDAYISWLRLVEATHGETWMRWAIYDMIKLALRHGHTLQFRPIVWIP